MAKQYNMEADKVKEVFSNREKDLKGDLLCKKAAELIAENAKEAKAAPEKKTSRKKKAAEDSEDK